jgi:hypothetical protein
MSEDIRASLIGGLWFFSAVVLAALFISAAAQSALTAGHILLAFVILGLVVAGTVFFLYRQDSDSLFAKAKRNHFDTLLRDMSDAELLELKQRLTDGDFHDVSILDYVGDDGELVWRS